jgi:co-chaperonin GroES (HSP10)
MAIAGSGDKLASGRAKSATYSGAGYGEGTMKPNVAPEDDAAEVPSVVDNSALFAPTKPAVYYKGKPFNKRILVTTVELERNSSIIVPESAKGHSEIGRIKAFSDDSELKNVGLKIGDLVLFDKYAAAGQSFPLLNENGETEPTLLLQECDIQMLMEEVRNTPEPSVN